MRDAQDRGPLIGANVILVGAGIGDATDENGRYILSNVTAGTYIIRVGYIGYTSVTDTLTITGETDIERDFEMSYTTLEGEELIVTAQAKGQMDAINRQLAEKSMVNIVSSDRIEELPDANAAESVARIPGVTVQREGGEGNKVVIRGLSPKYNALSVNGIRLAATDSSDRSTDLSMVSQYMLKGIEVTKAGTPDQDADVLGGTVNFKLKTAEPGFHINALAQGMYNGLRQSYRDYKLVLEVSNRFFNNRLGLLGLIDLENRNRSSHELRASYDNPNAQLDSLNALRTTGVSLFDITRKNDRLNGLLVADYDLSEGSVSYSFLNSSINSDQTTFFEAYALAVGGRTYASGWGDRKITVNTHILEYSQTLFSKLHIDASVSLSRSTQDFDRFAARFRENLAFTKLVLGVNVNSVQDFLKNDLATVYAEGYSIDRDANDETEAAARLDLGYDFRVFKYLSGAIWVGGKYRKKTRDYDKGVEYGRLDYVWQPAMDSLLVAFPRLGEYGFPGVRRLPYAAFIGEDYKEGDFLQGDFALGPFADLELMKDISDTGAVRDAHYGDPIAGAPVYLVGTPRVAVTKGNGRYALQDVPAGTFIIMVAHKGYTSESDTLVVAGEAELKHDFILMRAPTAGEAVARSPQAREQEGRRDPAASRIRDAPNSKFDTVCACFNSAIGVLNDAVQLRQRYENAEQYELDHEAVEQMSTLLKTWRTTQQTCLTRFGSRLFVDSACNRPGEISDRRRVLDSLEIKA